MDIDIKDIIIYLSVLILVIFVIVSLITFHHYFESHVQSTTALNTCGEDHYEYDTFRYKFLSKSDNIELVNTFIHFVYLIILGLIFMKSMKSSDINVTILLVSIGLSFPFIFDLVQNIMSSDENPNEPPDNKSKKSGSFIDRFLDIILDNTEFIRKTFSFSTQNNKNAGNMIEDIVYYGIIVFIYIILAIYIYRDNNSDFSIFNYITVIHVIVFVGFVTILLSFIFTKKSEALIGLPFIIVPVVIYKLFQGYTLYKFIEDFTRISSAIVSLISSQSFINVLIVSLVFSYYISSLLHLITNGILKQHDSNYDKLFALFNEQLKFWTRVTYFGLIILFALNKLSFNNSTLGSHNDIVKYITIFIFIEIVLYITLKFILDYVYDFNEKRKEYNNYLSDINQWFQTNVLKSKKNNLYFINIPNDPNATVTLNDPVQIDDNKYTTLTDIVDHKGITIPKIKSAFIQFRDKFIAQSNSAKTDDAKIYSTTVVKKKMSQLIRYINLLYDSDSEEIKKLRIKNKIEVYIGKDEYKDNDEYKDKDNEEEPSLLKLLMYPETYIKKTNRYVIKKDPNVVNENVKRIVVERYNILHNENIDVDYTNGLHYYNSSNVSNLMIGREKDITNELIINVSELPSDITDRYPILYISMYDGNIDKMVSSLGVHLDVQSLNSNTDIHTIIRDNFKKIDEYLSAWKYKMLMVLVFIISFVLMYLFIRSILYSGIFDNNFYNIMLFVVIIIIICTIMISIIQYNKNI